MSASAEIVISLSVSLETPVGYVPDKFPAGKFCKS